MVVRIKPIKQSSLKWELYSRKLVMTPTKSTHGDLNHKYQWIGSTQACKTTKELTRKKTSGFNFCMVFSQQSLFKSFKTPMDSTWGCDPWPLTCWSAGLDFVLAGSAFRATNGGVRGLDGQFSRPQNNQNLSGSGYHWFIEFIAHGIPLPLISVSTIEPCIYLNIAFFFGGDSVTPKKIALKTYISRMWILNDGNPPYFAGFHSPLKYGPAQIAISCVTKLSSKFMDFMGFVVPLWTCSIFSRVSLGEDLVSLQDFEGWLFFGLSEV